MIGELDDFDISWFADFAQKARHGIWLGKQVAFTFGPLFQWIVAKASELRGHSLASLYLSIPLVQFWLAIPALYGSGKLLLGHQPAWKRTFCLLLLAIFWMPVFFVATPIKFLLPVLLFTVFVRLMEKPEMTGAAAAWRGTVCAGFVVFSFLVSCDVGFYSLAMLLVVLFVRTVAAKDVGRELKGLLPLVGGIAGASAVFMFAVNLAFGAALDFHFWRGAVAVVESYRWSQARAMSPDTLRRFSTTIAICCAIFLLQYILHWKRKNPWTNVRLFAMLLAGIVFIESGIVVADMYHVAPSAFPLIILSCYLLFGAAAKERNHNSLLVVVLALGATAAFSGPTHVFIPHNLSNGFTARSSGACPSEMTLFDEACLASPESARFEEVSKKLDEVSTAGEKVIIFPYQNIYGWLAGRTVSGDVLQSYTIAGDYLNQKQLASWERDQARFAIYSPDDVTSVPLDGVPNFTRTPEEWFYLQRHYEFIDAPAAGVLLLRRNDKRAQSWSIQSFALSVGNKEWALENGSRIEIASPMLQTRVQPDFLRVKVRLNYPMTWKVLKPAFTLFYVEFADGSEKRVPAVIEPNHDYDVWIYPGAEPLLSNYFASDPRRWRTGMQPAMTGLGFGVLKMDWASVVPYSLEVRELDGLQVSLEQSVAGRQSGALKNHDAVRSRRNFGSLSSPVSVSFLQ